MPPLKFAPPSPRFQFTASKSYRIAHPQRFSQSTRPAFPVSTDVHSDFVTSPQVSPSTLSTEPHAQPKSLSNQSPRGVTLIVPLNISQSAVPQSTGEARAAKPLYHVARTSSGNLPVYSDSKRGGNLHQTIIRKISGDAGVLRDEIRDLLQRMASAGKKTPALSKIKKDVVLNSVNNHVIVKGEYVGTINKFLKEKGF